MNTCITVEHSVPRSRSNIPRTQHVRDVCVIGLFGYLVAALLGAPSLAALASRQEIGARRVWALRAVAPLVRASAWTRLDGVRAALDRFIHPTEPNATASLESQWNVPSAERPSPAGATEPAVPSSPVPQTRCASSPSTTRSRIWIAGDSMAGVFGPELARLANDTPNFRAAYESHHSTGLTRPDLFDWPGRIAEVVAARHPDITVLVFGANDAERLTYRNRAVSIDTPEWSLAYAARVARVMELATSGGRRVLWIGMPVMRAETFSRHMRLLDGIYRAEAARHPGVTFVDTWDAFADVDGSYTAYLQDASGVARLVREPDGIHYTRAGAARLATTVLQRLLRTCATATLDAPLRAN